MMDADHDGNITKAEFTAAEDKMFDRLDTNHDGVISKDELAAAHHSHHQDGTMPPPPTNAPAPDGTPAPDQAPTP
jgi:Ca2+-binding EF-hand superfamily protein